MRTLDDVESLSPHIEDVTIHLSEKEIKISSITDYGQEGFDDANNQSSQSAAGYLMEDSCRRMMQLLYPLTHSLWEEYQPDTIITIFLSKKTMEASLDIFADDSGSGAALIFNNYFAVGNIDDRILSEYLSRDKEKEIDRVKTE